MSIKVTCLPVVATAAMTAMLIGQGAAHAQINIQKSLIRDGWANVYVWININDCENQEIYVDAHESTNIGGKWRPMNDVYVNITNNNWCEWEKSTYASGYYNGKFVPPDIKLSSAAAVIEGGKIDICDAFGSCLRQDIFMEVRWTGVENISRSQYRSHYKSGPYNYVSTNTGINRNAEVAIELNIAGVEVPVPAASGSIGRATSGSVSISHGN